MFRVGDQPEYAVRSLLKTVRAATPIGSLPNHKSCREHGSEPGRWSAARKDKSLGVYAARPPVAME